MMINVTWINWNCEFDCAMFNTLDEAKRFIYEYILSQPVVINSVQITDSTNVYTPKVTIDDTQLFSNIVSWIGHNCKTDMEILKTPADSLRFVNEYLLGEPIVFDSLKIGDQSFKLVI